MGTVAAMQHGAHAESVFVDQDVKECAKTFATFAESRNDFVKFIKDGFWIDHLFQTKLLLHRSYLKKSTCFDVTFGKATKRRGSTDSTQRASISSSSKSSRARPISPESRGSFDELYANAEGCTYFSHEAMQSFLFAVISPLFVQNCKIYADLLQGEDNQAADDPVDLGREESEMLRLQEMLLGCAAYFDEHEHESALASAQWLHTLHTALMDCALGIIICRVDSSAGEKSYPPVFTNAAAKRRDSLLRRSRPGDLFEMWGMETDETTRVAMKECLAAAQPMRLLGKEDRRAAAAPVNVASVAAADGADGGRGSGGTVESMLTGESSGKNAVIMSPAVSTVLDITHIFDDAGVHRYVLGVQADVVDRSPGSAELRKLADSALLISHLVKCRVQVEGGARHVASLLKSRSVREL